MNVVVGDDLTLAVIITGFNQPLTAVTWSSSGVEITNDTARVTIINSDLSVAPATSVLTVSPVVNPAADEGLYTLSAESPAGATSLFHMVTVFGNEDCLLVIIIPTMCMCPYLSSSHHY